MKTNISKPLIYLVIGLAVIAILFETNIISINNPLSSGNGNSNLNSESGTNTNNVNTNSNANAQTNTNTNAQPNSGAIKVEFYVMSQCPYGTQVEDAIAPVLKKLGADVNFQLNFIASDNGDGTFRSLHGENEVKGDIVQLCAAKYDPTKYMDMILCQNKNAGQIPTNWETCAKDNGLQVEKIKACYEGQEGKTLLSENVKKAEAVQAQGSPTIYVNNQKYSGGRSENDFLRSICAEFTTKPQVCQDLPEPKKVNMILLNDKRCVECQQAVGVVSQIKGLFPGLVVKNLDYSDAEGKELYQKAGLKALPAMLFDDTVKDGEGYSQVSRYLEAAGTYQNLKIGSTFDPTKEICDNKIDDTGNGKVDCDDTDCTESMTCRVEKKNDITVFIMSDCPYGRKAIEALKGVIDNFGNKITYEVHYIASETTTGFQSLHGQYEVDEDIIQLCTKAKSPEKWFNYLYCRSTKGVKGKDWKECATETGVDTAAVENCFNGDEGKNLLKEDIKIAESLGVGGSPTWLANNKYQFSGIDSETVKTNLCKYNPGLEGCDATLSSDTGGVPAGGCGA